MHQLIRSNSYIAHLFSKKQVRSYWLFPIASTWFQDHPYLKSGLIKKGLPGKSNTCMSHLRCAILPINYAHHSCAHFFECIWQRYILSTSFSISSLTIALLLGFISKHYSDGTMSAMRLKTPAFRLFAHLFVQACIKENIKAPRQWPL